MLWRYLVTAGGPPLRPHTGQGKVTASCFGAVPSGTNSLIVAMNRAYDVEETRPLWKRYLLALGLALLAGTSLVASSIALVVGEAFGQQIARALDLSGVYQTLAQLARWPCSSGPSSTPSLTSGWIHAACGGSVAKSRLTRGSNRPSLREVLVECPYALT